MSALVWLQLEQENEQRQYRQHWLSLTDEQRDDERRIYYYRETTAPEWDYYRRLALGLITRAQWEAMFPLSDEQRRTVPPRYA